jgi:hypothetical protein
MQNRNASLWIWMCILPLAFDFKSPNAAAEHSTQSLIVFPAIVGTIALIMIGPRFAYLTPLRKFVSAALVLSVGGSVVAQVMQGNDVGNYLRVLLPFALFAIGFWAACRPWQPLRISQIETTLWYANVICLAYTFVYGLLVGWPVHDVRYRIISPTLLPLQGMLLFQFIIMRRFTLMTVLTFLLTLVVAIVSVTRSLFLATAMLAMLAMWLGSSTLGQLLNSSMRALGALLCIAVVIGGTAMISPEITFHWTQRLFAAEATQSDRDPTTLTRLAEMRDQYDEVTSHASTLLLGEGYGHSYRYSLAYLPYLEEQISVKDYYAIDEWTAGHNFWVYQLFAGGLIFGVMLPAAILIVLTRTAFAYRRWRRVAPREPMLAPFGRAVMMLAAFPAASIGGNPLGARFSGLVYGLALGLSVALYVQLRYRLEVAARHRHVVAEPAFHPSPQTAPLNPFVTPEPQ